MNSDSSHLAAPGTSDVQAQPLPELDYATVIASLDYAANMLREQANVGGYGFYRPANPHDFFPDSESCSAEEIANHKAACEAWDRGDYKRDDWDGWVYDAEGKPTMHILRAPWGIGSYSERDEEMDAHAHVLHRMAEVTREEAKAVPPAA